MGWMRTDHRFQPRVALLTIPVYQAVSVDVFRRFAALAAPEDQERFILDLIAQFRPDLAGGTVEVVNFDIQRREWEILYTHASFPPVPDGNLPPRTPLRKRPDAQEGN